MLYTQRRSREEHRLEIINWESFVPGRAVVVRGAQESGVAKRALLNGKSTGVETRVRNEENYMLDWICVAVRMRMGADGSVGMENRERRVHARSGTECPTRSKRVPDRGAGELDFIRDAKQRAHTAFHELLRNRNCVKARLVVC